MNKNKWKIIAWCVVALIVIVTLITLYLNPTNKIRRAAASGDSQAQLELGLAYYTGNDDVEPDIRKAIELFEKSAEQNNGEAEFYLGYIYLNGRVQQSTDEIGRTLSSYVKNEIRQRFPAVNINRLQNDDDENNVNQNFEKARYWLERSVEHGNADGQMQLAFLCLSGEGAEHKDHLRADKLFRAAAEQGNAEAQYYLGEMYSESGALELNPEQSLYWYEKSAEQGYPEAMFVLAENYYFGHGVIANRSEAMKWYKKLVESRQENFDMAASRLGDMYLYGQGVTADKNEAKRYFEIGCKADIEQGNKNGDSWLCEKFNKLKQDNIESENSSEKNSEN